MLRSAALDAGVELRQIEARQQSPRPSDPLNVPETDYLKFSPLSGGVKEKRHVPLLSPASRR